MSLASWDLLTGDTTDNLADNQYKIAWDGTGEIQGSMEQSLAPVTYYVKWSEHQRFIDDLMGYAVWPGGSTLQRTLPETHPIYDYFFASEFHLTPVGQPTQVGTKYGFVLAMIETTFKSNTFAIQADGDIDTELDRYVVYDYDAGVDYLTITGQLRFVTTNKVLSAGNGRRIPSTQIITTWLQVPADHDDPFTSPTENSVATCIGKLNDDVFLGRPKGTLLFVKPQTKIAAPRVSNINPYYWTIQYQFLYRNNGLLMSFSEYAGHNYIYNQTAGAFDLVTSDGTTGGNRIYEYADFNQLFDLSVG